MERIFLNRLFCTLLIVTFHFATVSGSLFDLNESENKLSVFLPSKDVLKSGWRNPSQSYDDESVSSYSEVTGMMLFLCFTQTRRLFIILISASIP